ncbi:MAG: NADPH:quinone oxidoreductase family protein [Acidimicrobiales bacterium]
MRAWQVQAKGEPIEVLRPVVLDRPEPGPGQVRIRVTAAGIGLPDVLMCRHTYPLTPPLPFIPGQEVSGVVTAIGEGIGPLVGDRVMAVTAFQEGYGSYAEECLAPVSSVFAVPSGLADVEAAGFWIPHLTAWIGLVDRGHLVGGEWLAVLGAGGGSGIAAVQLGRLLGARVIAVVGDEERASFCRSLGAEATVDHRQGPLAPALRELTGGHGVDLIYDPVGGPLAEDAAGALARDGRWLAVGFASGTWPTAETHQLVWANAALLGVLAAGFSRAELDDIHARLSGLVDEGGLHNAVTERVPFDDLPGALQRMADRRVVGKMVMVP